MDDKEPITSPDDPLGAAIQNFALYARGEGSFDELDLKEAIFAWHEADKQRAVREALEGLKQFNGAYIGSDGKRVDNMVHHVVIDEFIAQLSKEDV